MSYIIKAITANDILSFMGGSDGCSYMIDEKEACIFESNEKAALHLEENFNVTQNKDDCNKYRHSAAILSTIFFIEEVV